MNPKTLRNIQLNIRENFGKPVNWDAIPINKYNCYNYATNCTIPTEELVSLITGKPPVLKSIIGESIGYFSDIGNFSGHTKYSNTSELVAALTADFKKLGLKIEPCTADEEVSGNCWKIAFFYAREMLLFNGSHGNFHFLRFENGEWIHKCGWEGSLEKIGNYKIEEIWFPGLDFIGCFRVSLD